MGISSLIRRGRTIVKAHIRENSAISTVTNGEGSEGGILITIRSDHAAMQAVKDFDDFPGGLLKTSAVYKWSRVLFGLARLTWRGCYIKGTRQGLSDHARSAEFMRDETVVMNVSQEGDQLSLRLFILQRIPGSETRDRYVSGWNRDFKRFRETVEYYLRATPPARILMSMCALMVYNIDIGQNCEADILYQNLSTISSLANEEGSTDSDESEEDAAPFDSSHLIRESVYRSSGAMLLSSVRNRLFSDTAIFEAVSLGGEPDFGSCAIRERRDNRSVTRHVMHSEVKDDFMQQVLGRLREYNLAETVEGFDFLSVSDARRLESLFDEPYESLGFTTPELQEEHARKVMDYYTGHFAPKESEDKTLLWSAMMAEVMGLSCRHRCRRFAKMGRESTVHRNRNRDTLLCLAKEPKTVFLYGKEGKWFEEADMGGFLFEHETNDALKLIALTCALHHDGMDTGYTVSNSARKILERALEEGWRVSATVQELRRLKTNLDAEQGCLNLTHEFKWLREQGILLRGTEFDNTLERECIAEELYTGERYAPKEPKNGSYICALLQSKGSRDRKGIEVIYDEAVPGEGLRFNNVDWKARTISGGGAKITMANRGQPGTRTVHRIETTDEFCSGLENVCLTGSDYLDNRMAATVSD